MSSQDEQIQQRKSHLEALAHRGVATYPNRFDRRQKDQILRQGMLSDDADE